MNISEAGGALCSVNAERVTGFASQTVEEMLGVEEPLEIQLGSTTHSGRAPCRMYQDEEPLGNRKCASGNNP